MKSIRDVVPGSIKRAVPPVFKRALNRVFKPRLYRDIVKFKEDGSRFSPPVTDFPGIVRFEVTTRCNLHCSHCPHSVLAKNRDFLGDMDVVLYQRVIDEIAAESPSTRVRPFGGGEPLMRKDIAELIGYAKRKGIRKTSINTNGTLLVKRRRRELIENGLDHIEVSVDAATAETYLKIRQSPLYDKVVENTLAYIRESKEYNSKSLVTVSFVLQKKNRHELDAFVSFWKGKADRISIRPYHQHGGLVDAGGREDKSVKTVVRHPCPYLWRGLIVSLEGKVCFCENDWKTEYDIGDIRVQTLREIWHGELLRELRQQHIAGTFDHPFCKSCVDWREVRWPGM